MKILVVNDDSIHAPGIALLAKAAMELGEVAVVAPAHQCSAMSQKITIRGDMRVDQVTDFPVPVKAAYMVDGTPADCVKIAMQHLLEEKPDYVFSGINDGYNAGIAVHYSGTVGAAMEGAFHHLPAIAASIHHQADGEMLRHLARYTIETAEKYAKLSMPRGIILNINAPCVEPDRLKPPVYAPLDTAFFVDGYEQRESPRAGTYFWLTNGGEIEPCDPGSDNDYLEKGHITLTLIGNFASLDPALLKGLNG